MSTSSSESSDKAFHNFLNSVAVRYADLPLPFLTMTPKSPQKANLVPYENIIFDCSISGVTSIIVSDRDGVILTMTTNDQEFATSDSNKYLTATFVSSCDQSAKCGWGKNKSMVTYFENRIVVHFNALPLVITVVADTSANIGLVLQLQKDIFSAVEPIRQQLLQFEKDNAANV